MADEAFAVLAVAVDRLGKRGDEEGTSLHIHHCPLGDWIVYFGEADRVVRWGAQSDTFAGAVLQAHASLCA